MARRQRDPRPATTGIAKSTTTISNVSQRLCEPHWSDNLAAKIRATPPWVVFLWLALTAVLYAYVGKLAGFAFLFWLAIRGWIWFCGKYPRTALFVSRSCRAS